MNTAVQPSIAAAWLEGFLKGSGTLLLLDEGLWNTVNTWVSHLPEDIFIELLPLLRRTFSHFSPPERRKLGEKAKGMGSPQTLQPISVLFDEERGKRGLLVVLELFGL